MDNFETTYEQMLEMVSGDAFGSVDSSVGNSDFYAPDDARVPKILGIKKKRKKKDDKSGESIPIHRRPVSSGM